MVNLLTRAIMMSTPLFLGALAEVFAERTGMMVCAIEGVFLIGRGAVLSARISRAACWSAF
jgi:simple sugar transport system permease protein